MHEQITIGQVTGKWKQVKMTKEELEAQTKAQQEEIFELHIKIGELDNKYYTEQNLRVTIQKKVEQLKKALAALVEVV